jgi:hypothetical protein
MNPKGTEHEGVDWMPLSQNTVQWRAVVKTAMNLRVTKKERIFWNSRASICFSRMSLLHADIYGDKSRVFLLDKGI